MRVSAFAVLVLASLLAACGAADLNIRTDSVTGHFGTGMHAGRTAGR